MRLVKFDFSSKEERVISVEEIVSDPGPGVFYWVTFMPEERAEAERILGLMGSNKVAASALVGPQQEARYDLFEDAVHFSVTEAWFTDGTLKSGIVEFLLCRNFLAVMLAGPSPVMDQIFRIYREDFYKFARSSGFLIYELASHLLESYRRTYHNFTNAVEGIQLKLFGKVTDDIFMDVSQLTADILSFRRMVMASRDLLNELATRKSALVSETTQPSLGIIAGRMERMGDDLDSERSVLNETLNLYMGMVSHRTNKIINRLTIFSMIFLPLSFLCGVYGMNFEFMPELGWKFGYAAFWLIALVFVVVFVITIRKKKWI